MTLKIQPYKDLLETNVEWLVLKDHFIATVGENSGKGRPLKNILVIADARFRARSTFPMHPHKDMEILRPMHFKSSCEFPRNFYYFHKTYSESNQSSYRHFKTIYKRSLERKYFLKKGYTLKNLLL